MNKPRNKRECLPNPKVSTQKLAKPRRTKKKQKWKNNIYKYTQPLRITTKTIMINFIDRSITYEKFYSLHKYNQIIIIPLELYIIKIKLDQYNII